MEGANLGAWWSWLWDEGFRWPSVWRLAVLTVFSTVLGFHLMNAYQPRVPALRAALVYLLEPVFAAALSVMFQYESLSLGLVLGGALILLGNLVAELPGWLRRNRT